MTVSLSRFAVRTDLFRDQFIGILSHDLRTPIGAITTGAALLALPEDQPERRARIASRILNSAHRMERLIADLLDLTRARLGGTIPLARRRTDLQQLCEEAISEIRAANPGARVDLEGSGDTTGDWDADRLAQVVSNLLGNAIQHGQGTPVTVSVRPDGDAVRLAFHNGGNPIPPQKLPFIFEPLTQGQDTHPNPANSLGLGLFIARAVVCAHGGDIEVRSSAEDGTTVTARLPKSARVA
jgi:signal transduction histidine kinase